MGLFAYSRQADRGSITTSMRDPLFWAFSSGNFAFLVGVAAAAVVLVIPARVYSRGSIREVVPMAEAAMATAIGRPQCAAACIIPPNIGLRRA